LVLNFHTRRPVCLSMYLQMRIPELGYVTPAPQ
jgi:hypothetical protein